MKGIGLSYQNYLKIKLGVNTENFGELLNFLKLAKKK